jgi:pilus assembly protein CpaC
MTLQSHERDSLSPRRIVRTAILTATCIALALPRCVFAEESAAQAIMYKVHGNNERLEMVVSTSRILTMDQKVPQVLAANPDVVELTPLSATQVQILAKKPGVTQVNLWDEQQKIHTIDVIVYPDARELAMLLQTQFPTTALKVVPTANSVIISGHVDDPNEISRIIQIAEDFYPKVINNITIAGVQQVLLKVKVMEVSRTRLRHLGVDLRYMPNGMQNFFQSSISEILSKVASNATVFTVAGNDTMAMGVLTQNSAFFAFLDALRQEQLATIMAEPNLTAYSGRPARFNSGGEFPIIVPQSLGTVSFQYKPFGTQVEFVPIVLGNNAIRLEVYPRITEIDPALSVTFNGFTVPALKVREANTGVELRAGQTLALAGLVQHRRVYQKREIPWLGEIPYLGAMFRDTQGQDEEVELLFLVTPQLVQGMEPCEVPPGGPGTSTSSPSDCQLYWKGHIEVPRCPADDACAPSRSPGLLYEYSKPPGSPIGPSGPDVAPQDEIIEAPPAEPNPAARRVKPAAKPPATADAPRAMPPRSPSTASAPPATLDRSAPMRVRTGGPPSSLDNRSVSYKPNNRSAPPNGAARDRAKSTPGMIGPVGYDLRQ